MLQTNMKPLIAVIGILASLSGCATMNKDECATADWQTVGYEDGARGRALSYLGNHRKACAEHGITPDMQAYEQGRTRGLQEYCVPRKGFALGRSGKSLSGVCQGAMADAFERAWSEGQEVYQAESQLKQSQRLLKRHQQRLIDLQQQIEESEKALVSDGVSSQRRKELLVQVKDLSAELEDAEDDLPALNAQVQDDRDYLERLRDRYVY